MQYDVCRVLFNMSKNKPENVKNEVRYGKSVKCNLTCVSKFEKFPFRNSFGGGYNRNSCVLSKGQRASFWT